MTIGSLFSGIGGLELGLERAGLGPVAWQVEIDPFCRAVLAKHWPGVTKHEDVRSVGAHNLEPVDILCGGFPCQDVSAAGRRRGLAGERSGLWFEYRRIVDELRPSVVVVENVASGQRLWLPTVKEQLAELGYGARAFSLSAADVGAPHLRRRVFVVAYANGIEQHEQSGGRGWARGEGAVVAEGDGNERPVADAVLSGLEERGEQPAREERQAVERGGLSDDPWAAEPNVGRVAHGVPRRVDRLRALGNAVVPQCAEAIGRMIAEYHRSAHPKGDT
jgi:DNA (cytosine-5)-methyltransferase 1